MAVYNAEDLQLLADIKNSELQAFDQLFLKYYKNLLQFASSILPYPSDAAEDVVLEVFQSIWQHRKSIIISTSFSALLYKCVKNRVYDNYRKNRLAVLTTLEHIPADLEIHYATPDQLLNVKELEQNLERLIERLPEKMQIIFRMSREDHLTYQDIADLLDISVNSVKTQMYRAVKFLKASCRLDNSSF